MAFAAAVVLLIAGGAYLAAVWIMKLMVMKSNYVIILFSLFLLVKPNLGNIITALFLLAAAYLSEHSAKINLAFSVFAALIVAYGVVAGVTTWNHGFSAKISGLGIVLSLVLVGISLYCRFLKTVDRPKEYIPVIDDIHEDVIAAICWGCALFVILMIITCGAAILDHLLVEWIVVAVGAVIAFFLDRKFFEVIDKFVQEENETTVETE